MPSFGYIPFLWHKKRRGSQGKGILKDKGRKTHYCFSASLMCSVHNGKYHYFWMTLDVLGFIQLFGFFFPPTDLFSTSFPSPHSPLILLLLLFNSFFRSPSCSHFAIFKESLSSTKQSQEGCLDFVTWRGKKKIPRARFKEPQIQFFKRVWLLREAPNNIVSVENISVAVGHGGYWTLKVNLYSSKKTYVSKKT